MVKLLLHNNKPILIGTKVAAESTANYTHAYQHNDKALKNGNKVYEHKVTER